MPDVFNSECTKLLEGNIVKRMFTLWMFVENSRTRAEVLHQWDCKIIEAPIQPSALVKVQQQQRSKISMTKILTCNSVGLLTSL